MSFRRVQAGCFMNMKVDEFLSDSAPTLDSVRDCLVHRDERFWARLGEFSRATSDFSDLLAAATMRRRAVKAAIPGGPARAIKLAIVGGSSLSPLHELI